MNSCAGLICVWLTIGRLNSTGSSTVLMLIAVPSRCMMWHSAEYIVLVLPEPVGPVNSSRPLVRLSTRFKPCKRRVVKAQRVQFKTPVARVKQPDDDFLAARRRKNRDAQLHAVQLRAADGRAVLRQAGLIGDQVGHHLEARGNFVHQVERQMRDLGEHAVDAGAHGDGVFPRLDMQVAGAELDGVLHHAVDHHDDFGALGGDRFGLEILVV